MSLSDKEFVCDKSFKYDNKKVIVFLGDDVKEFIKELKKVLESDKYQDDEYPSYQQFPRNKGMMQKTITQIIDKLAGEKLKK